VTTGATGAGFVGVPSAAGEGVSGVLRGCAAEVEVAAGGADCGCVGCESREVVVEKGW